MFGVPAWHLRATPFARANATCQSRYTLARRNVAYGLLVTLDANLTQALTIDDGVVATFHPGCEALPAGRGELCQPIP